MNMMRVFAKASVIGLRWRKPTNMLPNSQAMESYSLKTTCVRIATRRARKSYAPPRTISRKSFSHLARIVAARAIGSQARSPACHVECARLLRESLQPTSGRVGIASIAKKNADWMPLMRILRAVIGAILDRSFENQRDRASGLNLVVAAIVLWNTSTWSEPYRRCGTQERTWKKSCCRTFRRLAGSTST